MNRVIAFIYGVVAYVIFLAVFLYMVGFLANQWVPRTVDNAPEASIGTALGINLLLVSLFGLQHTVMARPTFKRWWTQFVPQSVERSTYVMLTNVILVLLYWQWRSMPESVWLIQNSAGATVLWGIFAAGWVLVLVTTFLINHFELFGLQQIWFHLRNKTPKPHAFVTPGPYKLVRHPLYVGWLMTFWATPAMTAGHLVFALGMTVYILVAIYFEERNLLEYHGEVYAEYRQRTPMLIPLPMGKK